MHVIYYVYTFITCTACSPGPYAVLRQKCEVCMLLLLLMLQVDALHVQIHVHVPCIGICICTYMYIIQELKLRGDKYMC